MKQLYKTSQLALSDRDAAIAAGNRGVEKAAEHKSDLVEHARELAVKVAIERGRVTADDVAAALIREGYKETALGNAAGAVFKDRRFVWTLEVVKSVRMASHGRLIRVWRLK